MHSLTHSFPSLSPTSTSYEIMKQVLMILASVMAVASGRMLQDENITSTLSNSSLIDEAVKPELIDENENTSEVASPDEDNGNGADAITLWRVQPQPLPANYVITAQFKSSDEDTQYGYTVAVAGVDASISPNTGPGSDDDDAPVLYFNLDQRFCDTNAMSPTSFQTSKFQIPDENSPTLSTALKVCWAAPPGYYISQGIPTNHRLIFQIFHYSLGADNWTYDGTISTTEGKGKLLVTCQTNAYACMLIYIELNSQPHINLSSLFISQTKLMFGSVSMWMAVVIFSNYQEKRVTPSNTALGFKEFKSSWKILI